MYILTFTVIVLLRRQIVVLIYSNSFIMGASSPFIFCNTFLFKVLISLIAFNRPKFILERDLKML